MDLREVQQRARANKVRHGFYTTDVPSEFMLLVGEVSEAFSAWRKGKAEPGEELADIAIFLAGAAGMTGHDLQAEVDARLEKNTQREYEQFPSGTLVKRETPELGK